MVVAVVAVAAVAVSTYMQVEAQKQAGKAQQQAADFNAQQSVNQAAINQSQAKDINRQEAGQVQIAQQATAQKEEMARQQLAHVRLMYAGARTDTGTPFDVLINGEEQLKQNNTQDTAQRFASIAGMENQSNLLRSNASSQEAQAAYQVNAGQMAMDNANYAAMGTAIGGIGTMASMTYNSGMFNSSAASTANTTNANALNYNKSSNFNSTYAQQGGYILR